MPSFAYEARDENGQLTGGLLTADSIETAGRTLSDRNLSVVRLAADDARHAAASDAARATRADVAWFMTQLSIMVETGIRLSDALACLHRQTTRPRLKALLGQISTSVEDGRSLSDAMAMHPRSFPPALTALIRSSEISGTMSAVLKRSAAYLVHELEVMRRVRAAMTYPALMMALCLAVTLFLITVILPRFTAIFAGREAVLPAPTRLLLSISESMTSQWPIWLTGASIIVATLLIVPRTAAGRRQIETLLVTMPVISHIFNTLYQGRTFRTLGVLLGAGVKLVDAVRIAQQIVPNHHYRRLWLDVDSQIQHGRRLAGPLLESPLISEPVAQMLNVGDQSGRLGTVCTRLAEFIEEEHEQAVKSATQLIEPAMILIMGGVIGFIAASLMLPLFQAGNVMAQ